MAFDMETTGRFVIENPLYVYGLMRVPNQQRYDAMDAVFASSAYASQNVFLEPSTNVLMLQPTPLQVPTARAQWTFPSAAAFGTGETNTAWHEVTDSSSGLTVLEMPDSHAGRAFVATSQFALTEDGGFFLNIYRSEAASNAARSPGGFFTQLLLADGIIGGLRLTLAYGQPPILEVQTSVDSHHAPVFVEVARAADTMPDCEAFLAGVGDRTFRLRVLPLASEGAIVIDFQGGGTLVFRLGGVFLPPGPLTVRGVNGTVRVQYLPMRFAPFGAMLSSIKEHGTAIVNDPVCLADAASEGGGAAVTVECTVMNGTQTQYALTLSATGNVDASGFATLTPLVRSVTIFLPGSTYNDTVSREVIMNPRRVRESLRFDLATLSYSQSADITCDNHYGQWTGASGYRAGLLEAGINGDNWRRITGHVISPRQTRSDPVRETIFRLEGKEHWLKRRAVGEMGPLDGWDIFAAVRFLCQKGGITDDYMTTIPYTYPGRGTDTPYYHLPVGTGYNGDLFQFDPRTKIWDALQQVARKVRGYIGFDCFGYLRFYRWSAEWLGAWMQVFDVVPGSYNGNLLYNQMKNAASSSVDLSDVRSDITLGAIDPFTFLPVFGHAHNESVVTDITDPSFLGNEDAYIEINPLLFDPGMQQETLDALQYQTSLPGLSVDLQAYFQHRLFPLDIITVSEGYLLGGIYPFYVLSMDSEYGINEQAHFGGTTLTGRWALNG